MNRYITSLVFIFAIAFSACANDSSKIQQRYIISGGLKLPKGFKAIIVADKIGDARHIVVNSNGDVYVKLDRLKDGKGILRLRDNNGDGVADETFAFGNFAGTGIAIRNGYLYASSDEAVYRYKLNSKNEVENPDQPELIVTGLVNRRQHAAKSITLDDKGNLYVNIGAPSNACQETDRTAGSPGQMPCPLLEIAGGIWQFKADKLNQGYADGVRYVTGLRNCVAIDWNFAENELYVIPHGRDQLNQLHPTKFSVEQSAELPAEEFFLAKKGMDFGWPYCYYDPIQKKKLQNPEYGGDGKTEGDCGTKEKPLFAFPAHWAPNDLLFYTGNQFAEKYKGGAFFAFHGSWNRAPLKQGGYNIVFLPMKEGKPSGGYEIFADDFAGGEELLTPNKALHRPCGLALGTDGSLYVSDDQGGTVWKIIYTGEN
jgi:glucose/arabinose dehydrogenase